MESFLAYAGEHPVLALLLLWVCFWVGAVIGAVLRAILLLVAYTHLAGVADEPFEEPR